MHSRIYELKRSLTEQNTLAEDTISLEIMYYYGMDYIVPADDRELEIKLFSELEGVTYDEDTKAIRFDKKVLMEDDYKKFKENVKELGELSFDDFCGDSKNREKNIRTMMSYLNWAYEDDWGYFVYTEDSGMMPLNAFLRDYATDIPYYIGNIMDYHK